MDNIMEGLILCTKHAVMWLLATGAGVLAVTAITLGWVALKCRDAQESVSRSVGNDPCHEDFSDKTLKELALSAYPLRRANTDTQPQCSDGSED